MNSFIEWLDAYGAAWQDRDAEAVVILFSDNSQYYETPFAEPMVGEDAIYRYWSEFVRDTQRDVRFVYEAIAVLGNRGLAKWQAAYVSIPSGKTIELDGILIAEFNDVGKCSEFREWWHHKEVDHSVSPPSC